MNQDDEKVNFAESEEENEHQFQQSNEFEQEMTMNKKASLIVNDINELLCAEISRGIIQVQDEQTQFSIERKPLIKSEYIKAQIEKVDPEEHRKKVRNLMQANKKFRQKLNNRTILFENSLKRSEEQEKRFKNQQKQNQLQKRRQTIQRRMANKSQMMAQIRKMSLQSEQRFKSVRKQKFLYEEKQEEFKSRVLLPKVEEQKKILEKRKEKMKAMDIKKLIEHQRSYYQKKKTQEINRSMTSRIIKSSTFYDPPEFVPKSYQIYEIEQKMKNQQKMMKIKEIEVIKQRTKEYVKNVSQIQKLQKEIHKSRSISPQERDSHEVESKKGKKKRQKVKQMSKKELNEMGNSYFKALQQQIKMSKQKKENKAKFKEKQLDILKQQRQKDRSIQDELQIQIRSQSIRTVQKIEKIQRTYRVRSKKIESIFNDQSIDPLLKYQKLKHQVQSFDMVLKSKNLKSQDIKERTEAAGCYMNAIRAKLKLLEVSASK